MSVCCVQEWECIIMGYYKQRARESRNHRKLLLIHPNQRFLQVARPIPVFYRYLFVFRLE